MQCPRHRATEASHFFLSRNQTTRLCFVPSITGADDGEVYQILIAAAAPLVLTACLWSPGKFVSELTLRKNGKGVFTVDYRGEGSLAQDVAFPIIADSDLMLPFVALCRCADVPVLVTGPAFTGGSGPFGARAKMMGLPDGNKDGP